MPGQLGSLPVTVALALEAMLPGESGNWQGWDGNNCSAPAHHPHEAEAILQEEAGQGPTVPTPYQPSRTVGTVSDAPPLVLCGAPTAVAPTACSSHSGVQATFYRSPSSETELYGAQDGPHGGGQYKTILQNRGVISCPLSIVSLAGVILCISDLLWKCVRREKIKFIFSPGHQGCL